MSVKYTVTCKKETIDKIKSLSWPVAILSCLSIGIVGIPMLILTIVVAAVSVVIGIPLLCLLIPVALIKAVYHALTSKCSGKGDIITIIDTK